MLRSLLSSLVRHVTELFEFLIELLLPSLAVYLPKVDHFAPVCFAFLRFLSNFHALNSMNMSASRASSLASH